MAIAKSINPQTSKMTTKGIAQEKFIKVCQKIADELPTLALLHL